ncbi:hypothetical protein BCR35DRAFT_301948 [Leucosporidium creatinivorum]|uniref:Uncharacterized protein n=1 Tax=Leucosporidium creatinivorum TaxID=106004 RepID=A0A1Y2FXM4_9BASI|nr:hypothetical protein BCR35DRAFT_301948 [Leucosporidium creatinivorum]
MATALPASTAATGAPATEDVPPQFHLTSLDEEGVASLFASLGFPFYQAQLKDHGITGDILVHLDHEALRDVGIHSVGQRLAILRAVYALKVQQNIPVEEGQWVPPSEDMEDAALFDSPVLAGGHGQPSAQMMNLLGERDDRIRILESEVQKLHDTLLTIREDVMRPASKPPRPSATLRSPTSTLFPSHHPHPLSNQSTLSRSNSKSTNHGPSRSTSSTAVNIGIPSSSSGATGMPDSPRSPMESPRMGGHSEERHEHSSTAPLGVRSHYSSSTTLAQRAEHPRDVSSSSSNLLSSSTNPSSSSSSSSRHHDPSSKAEKEKNANADNPYRSFRVTLEDPCHKVLPAALKKYKINDDWRQYALFICYGNTERCLAYDEKPLLLFQRLKESNNNPVFMLPKHAARREKRGAGVGGGVDRALTVNRDGVASRPTRLHHPPVLLPVGKDKEAEVGKKEDLGAPPPSPREAPGYCISIYPYLAEREDEFDVTVGDTFVIISKTKGWWVVHRDLGPSHQLDSTTPRKSAWVPAGCLLETSVPPLSLAPPLLDIVSTPNVALMDYERQGSDELEVRKGTGLRILKRYNHCEFCGRASRTGDGTPTTPTTAEGRAATSSSSSSSDARGLSLTTSSGGRERSTSSAAAAKSAAAAVVEEDGEATLVAGKEE